MLPLPDVAPPEPIEGYAQVALQSTCDPVEKPGVAAFRTWLMAQRGGRNLGITRPCETGGTSEHKEGRAWDWGMNASNPDDAARVDDTMAWLLAPDGDGNANGVFRRLGLMYVIWNRSIWSARTRRWVPYTGANPHTDHVHFSFGWPGAMAQTSFFRWLGTPAAPVPAHVPPPVALPPSSPIVDGDPQETQAGRLVAAGIGIVLGWSILTFLRRHSA